MIPWSLLTQIRQTAKSNCQANFRVMFGQPEITCTAPIVGIYFHDPDTITLQLNERYRSLLQLGMLETPAAPSSVLLCLMNWQAGVQQRCILWRDPSRGLSMSVNARGWGLRAMMQMPQRVCRSAEEDSAPVCATQGNPSYVLVLKSPAVNGVSRHRRYLTTTCVPCAEEAWARDEFFRRYPETDGADLIASYHANFRIANFETPAAAERMWWIYDEGQPRRVATVEAQALLSCKRISHVCADGTTEWLTSDQAGLSA